MQLEFDFGEQYKVVCVSDYCVFIVAIGTKEFCETYIKQNSNENCFPLELRESY
jgi:hypothetical protein